MRAIIPAFGVFATVFVASALYSFSRTELYEATASCLVPHEALTVTSARSHPVGIDANMVHICELVQSDQFVRRVASRLGEDASRQILAPYTTKDGRYEKSLPEVLAENHTAKPDRDSSLILISHRAPDPMLAANLANLFSAELVQWTSPKGIDADSVRRVDDAHPPSDYISPNHLLDLSLGGVLALLAAALTTRLNRTPNNTAHPCSEPSGL